MLMGFGEVNAAGAASHDTQEISAGRLRIWPYVVEKIEESPVIGHGRLAMNRTGVAQWLMTNLGESFPHPHNAYLECLLDNGIVGLVPIVGFYVVVIAWSFRLFVNRLDPLAAAVGGVALALTLGLLVAGFGAQHFYPREPNTPMWAAIFLMFRVWVERKRSMQRVPLSGNSDRKGRVPVRRTRRDLRAAFQGPGARAHVLRHSRG
jgi:O-antigen ligase